MLKRSVRRREMSNAESVPAPTKAFEVIWHREEQLAATYKTWVNPELEFVEQVMLQQCLPEETTAINNKVLTPPAP
jgi:hypothetical protein